MHNHYCKVHVCLSHKNLIESQNFKDTCKLSSNIQCVTVEFRQGPIYVVNSNLYNIIKWLKECLQSIIEYEIQQK